MPTNQKALPEEKSLRASFYEQSWKGKRDYLLDRRHYF